MSNKRIIDLPTTAGTLISPVTVVDDVSTGTMKVDYPLILSNLVNNALNLRNEFYNSTTNYTNFKTFDNINYNYFNNTLIFSFISPTEISSSIYPIYSLEKNKDYLITLEGCIKLNGVPDIISYNMSFVALYSDVSSTIHTINLTSNVSEPLYPYAPSGNSTVDIKLYSNRTNGIPESYYTPLLVSASINPEIYLIASISSGITNTLNINFLCEALSIPSSLQNSNAIFRIKTELI